MAASRSAGVATYSRDSSTGLDYALNRYYGSSMGRFLTPDPYGGSAKLGRPNSWNRYAYVENDPVNHNDPSGLFLPGDYSPYDYGDFSHGWWYIDNSFWRYPYFWQPQFGGGGGGGGTAPPPPPRFNKDRLVEGAADLIDKKDCGDFLVGVGQRAFLNIAGKSNTDELSTGERSYYDAITGANIIGRLQGANFSDANRSETDQHGNTVSARAEYGSDGTGQSVTFFDAFFGHGTKERNQTVVHEGMHLIFRFGDSDLARGAGVYRGDSNASADFQKELQKNCTRLLFVFAPLIVALVALVHGQSGIPEDMRVSYFVSPEYPRIARQLMQSGDVVLTVTVDASGRPTDIAVKAPHVLLGESAKGIVSKWLFVPLLLRARKTCSSTTAFPERLVNVIRAR